MPEFGTNEIFRDRIYHVDFDMPDKPQNDNIYFSFISGSFDLCVKCADEFLSFMNCGKKDKSDFKCKEDNE
jgi:hypothetical protein